MNETALRGSAANSPTGNAQVSQPASEAGLTSECEPNSVTWGPAALEQRRNRTRDHLTKIAARREDWINRNEYYYELLNRLLRFLVEPQKKVLSVRCGTGNLLAVVRPSRARVLTSALRLWKSRSNEIRPSNSRSLSQTRRSSSRLSRRMR